MKLSMIVLAAALAVSPACKKKDAQNKPATGSGSQTMTGSGSGSAGSDTPSMTGSGSDAGSAGSGSADAAGSGSAAAAEDPNADYIKVLATHAEPKPTDPVTLKFEKFTVKKADFDPKKIEGGKATIEVDAASLKSDSEKRDAHVKSGDYIDTGKFATFTIDIDNVKKKDDKNFTADAKVNWRGVEMKYPVAFEVLEATDDGIRVKGSHKVKRKDFKVGGDPDKSVAAEVEVQVQLNLKKT
jgi:polyisoprenoid-binding protein YceI